MDDRKVLIVDDDLTILDVLARRVASLGFKVGLAPDGLAAVARLQEETFHLVLTDIRMPKMDGVKLLRHIKKQYPHINVIVMTGFQEEYSMQEVIEAGAIDYIEKPFPKAKLQEKLLGIFDE